MEKYIVKWFFIAFSLVHASSIQATDLLDLYLADAAPLTMDKNQDGYGVVGDVTLAAITRAGYSSKIQMVPWARAQLLVSRGTNQLIIPLTRTPERESSYTWIASIMPMERAFFSLDTPVKGFDEARSKYQRIAVGAGTAQLEILKNQNFSDAQIHLLKLGDSPIRMLELGRVDAWFTGVFEGLYTWPNSDVSKISAKLKMSPVVYSGDLYLACSLNCDAALVKKLQASVQSLHADGSIQRIKKTYLRQMPK
jgi:polar amino acid transport system substrate-binding protein